MTTKNTLHLTIASVDKTVFEGEVLSVIVPGVEGVMTILANHEALISPLTEGKIEVKTETETTKLEIKSGTLEISENTATILI